MKADFYKAPHHSVTGIAPIAFSETVNPRIMMLPQTLALWRHPRGELYNRWAHARHANEGMMSCSNGLNGTIRLTFNKVNVLVNPERSTELCQSQRLVFESALITSQANQVTTSLPTILNLLLEGR